MRFRRVLILFAVGFAGLAAAAGTAYAHHGFAAEYDVNQRVTVTGALTGFDWTNPHAWLHIDVKGADGKVENWTVEFGSPNTLYRRGFRREDFPVGVTVVVEGYRAKNGSLTLSARNVKLPDGRSLFAGSSAPDAPQ